jgi:hypothetical protein
MESDYRSDSRLLQYVHLPIERRVNAFFSMVLIIRTCSSNEKVLYLLLAELVIKKEMMNVGVAFKILEEKELLPVGYKKATGHLVYDVKMDFTRKTRWVKDGHRTPDPDSSSYAGVVSRESIRILLTHAALHGTDVMAADIRNAYLQAPTSEKHYVICGPEFGLEHVGKHALIPRALYGGKVAGRDLWHHLRSCMKHMRTYGGCFVGYQYLSDIWAE